MATANDIINRALRTVNVLESGEIPTAAESQDALTALNVMIDAWQAERLMIWTVSRLVLADLTNGQQDYTLGPGGYFDMPRPANIERYGILTYNNPSQPLELPLNGDGTNLTLDGWANVPVKNVQSSFPLWVWDQGDFPLRTLSFWCIPNARCSPVIYPWQLLNSFPDLTTDESFPPAYEECIVYNLALRLSMEWSGNIPAALPGMAQLALARVKSFNIPMLEMGLDPFLTSKSGYYNWISDTFGPGPR